jgi:hypothetical protein
MRCRVLAQGQRRRTNRWTGAAVGCFVTSKMRRRLNEFAPPGQLKRSAAHCQRSFQFDCRPLDARTGRLKSNVRLAVGEQLRVSNVRGLVLFDSRIGRVWLVQSPPRFFECSSARLRDGYCRRNLNGYAA